MNRKRTGKPLVKSTEPAPSGKVSGVRALIEHFENTPDQDRKISVTEYIRLIQLEREIDLEEPHDIEVLWIDRPDDPSSGAD